MTPTYDTEVDADWKTINFKTETLHKRYALVDTRKLTVLSYHTKIELERLFHAEESYRCLNYLRNKYKPKLDFDDWVSINIILTKVKGD